MRIFFLALMLVGCSVKAQWLNYCSDGQVCRPSSIVTTGGASGASVCASGNNADWSWGPGTSVFVLNSYTAGSGCSTGASSKLTVSINDAIVRSNGAGGFTAGSEGFMSSLAFASFPVCNGAREGTSLYDSTNKVNRVCNATVWVAEINEQQLSAHFPLGIAVASGILVIQQRMQVLGYPRRLQHVIMVAGTGAGTFTVELRNSTTATVLCTTAAANCIAVAGSVTGIQCTGTSFATLDDLQLRVNSAGCTTSPALNITASLTGAP